MAQLSTHDKAILNCIFNPNLPLTDCYEEELSEEIKGKISKLRIYNILINNFPFSTQTKKRYRN